MKITKEFRIGVSTIIILFCSYWGISYLKSANIFESNHEYHLSLEDATGISISTSVNVKGVKIGAVNRIKLNQVNDNVNVTISLKNRFIIPNDSYLCMRQVGIMDAPILELIPGVSETPYANGQSIKFVKVPGMQDMMDNLATQLSSVMGRVDSLAGSFQKLVSDKNISSISNTLSLLESSSASLNGLLSSQGDRINRIMSNVEQISQTFKGATPEVQNILTNFNSISDSLNSSVPAMMSELNSLLERVGSGDGTIGKLIDNDQLYNNIDSLSSTLNTLMQDIKENPKKYVQLSVWERRTPQEKYDLKQEKKRIKELKKADKLKGTSNN